MDSPPGRTWARPAIGWLALAGGLCTVAGILYVLAAPVLILAAGVVLMVEWRNPELDRWGRAVCSCGVAAYLVSIVALIACGDIEGGIPVGAQVFWQPIWITTMIAAVPLLLVGGGLVLARRRQARAA